MRRQRAGAVAGMNSRFLDMLHDAGNHGVLSVGKAINIDLNGIGEITIDEQRALFRDHKLGWPIKIAGQSGQVAIQLNGIENDLHGAPSEHIGGPDHDGIADRLGDGARLAGLVAMPLNGWRSLSRSSSFLNRSRSSARSIMSGEVPSIGTFACSSGCASLSGVWPPNCTITP